jgi:hypothetical protein
MTAQVLSTDEVHAPAAAPPVVAARVVLAGVVVALAVLLWVWLHDEPTFETGADDLALPKLPARLVAAGAGHALWALACCGLVSNRLVRLRFVGAAASVAELACFVVLAFRGHAFFAHLVAPTTAAATFVAFLGAVAMAHRWWGSSSFGLDRRPPRQALGEVWARVHAWLTAGKPRPFRPPAGRPVVAVLDADYAPPPPTGDLSVCLSGGGIRSASFNLGALQSLSLLPGGTSYFQRTRYLSTVSGGGYIGAGFAAAHQRGDAEGLLPNGLLERQLRRRTTYLVSFLRGPYSTAVRVLHGLTVNVLLIGLGVFCLAWPLGWLAPTGDEFRHPDWLWVIGTLLATASVLLGIVNLLFSTRDKNRLVLVWSSRLLTVGWVLVGVYAVLWALDWGAEHTGTGDGSIGADVRLGGAGGGVALVSALVAGLTKAYESRKKLVDGVTSRLGRATSWLRRIAFTIAIGLAVPALLLAGVMFVAGQSAQDSVESPVRLQLEVAALLALLVLWHSGDVDRWSLHRTYRDALEWAFLRPAEGSAERTPDPPDTLGSAALLDATPLVELGTSPGPQLLVNAAANLAEHDELWVHPEEQPPYRPPPGRTCVPWVFSGTEVGSPVLGWYELAGGSCPLPTIDGNHELGRYLHEKLTLASAVAVSGAAVSPSMGKMTKRRFAALLAITNLRLGIWFPNPSRQITFTRAWYPSPWYLLREAVGSHRGGHRFVYLTDGGHYDNLGLVEVLRRGETAVVCFDAAGDHASTFSTLGQAVGLAGADHAIEIDIDPTVLAPEPVAGTPPPDEGAMSPRDHCVGLVTWPNGVGVPTGWLLYAKVAVTADAPWDVRAYHANHGAFPFHSTAGQFYDHERFEAYRKLGRHVGDHVARTLRFILDGVVPPGLDVAAVKAAVVPPPYQGPVTALTRAAALRRNPGLLDVPAAEAGAAGADDADEAE